MGDRRVDAYALATALNQAQLDETFRGGENDIHTIATLTKVLPEEVLEDVSLIEGSPGVYQKANHGLTEGQYFEIDGIPGSGAYVRNPTSNTFNSSATPDGQLLDHIGTTTVDLVLQRTVVLRFSDRAKYVDGTFYHGRAKFPTIKRTIGELVAPTIQFGEMSVELNNVDGFYNRYLVGGDSYINFVGARLVVQVGLRDSGSTYFTIFDGVVPDDDGYDIGRQTITIRARDRADQLNRETGLPKINTTDYPDAPQSSLGKIIPMALGDWEAGYNYTPNAGTVSVTNGGTQFDVVTDAPLDFYGGLVGYYVGGGFFVFSIGTYTPDTISMVHIKRGDMMIPVTFNPTPANAAGYWAVEVMEYYVAGGGFLPYLFQDGDVAIIKVKIPYAAGQYSNPIRIAKEILFTLGDLTSDDLDTASWDALESKASPSQSALASIPMRIWIGKERDKILEYVLQHLEQVRVEMYWDRNNKIALRSLHPEDFPSQGSFRFEQIYFNEDSFKVEADTRNFFNKALANYAYTPVLDKTGLQTRTLKNQNSIDKSGREVEKAIDLPGLYVEADAINQLTEFIRFYSTGHEYVTVQAAWTTMLRDLGEIVMVTYQVGSINYDNKPMKIRDITFDPANASFTFRLLSLANFPYTGNEPANAAQMLSSATQTIEDA